MSALGFVPWILAGALAAAIVTRPPADEPPVGCGEGCATACELDVTGLGLSELQVDAVTKACAASGRRLQAIAGEAGEVRRRLDAELDAARVDEERVRELGRRLAGLREQRLSASLECVLGVRRVLSAEQMRELCARCGCATKE